MRTISYVATFFSLLLLTQVAAATEHAKEVTLYKNPYCECCEGYARYLRANGYEVTVVPTHELVQMSQDAGIPEKFQGCHLSYIDQYVVSGHVPIPTIERLLAEKPPIAGITLPGMPAGSPGMPGEKKQPFVILEVNGSSPRVYAVE